MARNEVEDGWPSFSVTYDDGKPESQTETEGQRLARFFATSAHEGHERRPPTWERVKARVSWPQSKRIAFGDIVYGVQYVRCADPRAVIDRDGEVWCTVWDTHITSDVDPGHPIIVEAQGALRVLAAALEQERERG